MKIVNRILLSLIIFSPITVALPATEDAVEENLEVQEPTILTHAEILKEELVRYMNPTDSDPDPKKMAQLKLMGRDMTMHVGGCIDENFFIYNRVNTLRNDYDDQNDFIRHKLNLDMLITHGMRKFGKPTTQAFARLTNYVFWQKHYAYGTIGMDDFRADNLNDFSIAKNTLVKTLLPLIFVEQAWFKINFDTFTDAFKDKPTSFKIGYFPYTVGRGVSMGYHADVAVELLGWQGQQGFTRFPFMPPGMLLRTQLNDNLSWDVYFNQWLETNAGLIDTLLPTRQQQLNAAQPQRGTGKDRITLATRLDYTKSTERSGDFYVQPYLTYVRAPEQTVELLSDASSKLWTPGIMANWTLNNWHVNAEIAGQFGHQKMHALDRNQIVLTRSRLGVVENEFTHIVEDNFLPGPSTDGVSFANAAVQYISTATATPLTLAGQEFAPNKELSYIANQPNNRALSAQGEVIATKAIATGGANASNAVNANIFGNARFRNPYRLDYRGFMGLFDIDYTFEEAPFKLAASAGYISGDSYPYNEERSRTFGTFVPLRSRYAGGAVRSLLIFDRLIIPRPLNISYRTLYAYNNTDDLSNLQFLGFGATWYPFKNREKFSVGADLMFLWEAATLKKWDINGKHPDPRVEAQLSILRNTIGSVINAHGVVTTPGTPTLFSGWESTQDASKHLGTEIDVKMHYRLLEHCEFFAKLAVFMPGQLYKDLNGQPNIALQRVDSQTIKHFDSLGSDTALAMVVGLDYAF